MSSAIRLADSLSHCLGHSLRRACLSYVISEEISSWSTEATSESCEHWYITLQSIHHSAKVQYICIELLPKVFITATMSSLYIDCERLPSDALSKFERNLEVKSRANILSIKLPVHISDTERFGRLLIVFAYEVNIVLRELMDIYSSPVKNY